MILSGFKRAIWHWIRFRAAMFLSRVVVVPQTIAWRDLISSRVTENRIRLAIAAPQLLSRGGGPTAFQKSTFLPSGWELREVENEDGQNEQWSPSTAASYRAEGATFRSISVSLLLLGRHLQPRHVSVYRGGSRVWCMTNVRRMWENKRHPAYV